MSKWTYPSLTDCSGPENFLVKRSLNVKKKLYVLHPRSFRIPNRFRLETQYYVEEEGLGGGVRSEIRPGLTRRDETGGPYGHSVYDTRDEVGTSDSSFLP